MFDGVRKIAPRSGSVFGLGLALELGLGAIFLGGKFLRTMFDNSETKSMMLRIFLEILSYWKEKSFNIITNTIAI